MKHAKGKPYSVAKKNGGFTLFENGVQMARVGIQGGQLPQPIEVGACKSSS